MVQVIAGLLLTAAVLGALAAIGKALLYVFAVLRRFNRWLDDWEGEPPRPGFPDGRPGVLARLASIEDGVGALPALRDQVGAFEKRLAAVEAQLISNGGGSLRDAVDRIAHAPTDGLAERSAIVQQ